MPWPYDKSNKRIVAFASNLRRLRKKRGWTVAEMGKASGISRQQVNQIEIGKNANVTLLTFLALAEALGVSLEEFRRPIEGE